MLKLIQISKAHHPQHTSKKLNKLSLAVESQLSNKKKKKIQPASNT